MEVSGYSCFVNEDGEMEIELVTHNMGEHIKMTSVDKAPLKGVELPSNTETAKILWSFDKEIPPSGRT